MAIILITDATLNEASAVAAPDCSNGPFSSDFRTAAQQKPKNQPIAKLASVAGTPDGISIDLVIASSSAASPGDVEFDAFYLPPSLIIDIAIADNLIKLEKVASISESISVLPTSSGALLLVPIAPRDCRLLLLEPTGAEFAFPEVSARRTMDPNVLSKLVDDLYRRMFPSAPTAIDIIKHGIADPIFKWRFAQAMQKPFTVLVPSDIFPQKPTTPVAKISLSPSLPIYALWQRAIDRFAWPDSLIFLELQARRYWPLLIQISLRSNEIRQPNEVNNDLAALHNMLSEFKTMGELAKKDFASLTKLDVTSLDSFSMVQYMGHLAMLERMIGNDYDLIVSNATAQYKNIYAKLVRSPTLAPSDPFNREKLLKYRSKQHQDDLSLAPLMTSNLDKVITIKSDQIPKGEAYILFKDVRDPITQIDLIQTEIVLALSTESLLNALTSALSANIPGNSCELRYSRGPLVSSVNDGALIVSADVKVQIRACINHDWICFKGWIPRWCNNTIKTDLFEIHDMVSSTLLTVAGEQAIETLNIVKVPYQTSSQISRQIPFKSVNNMSVIKNRITLKKAFFTKIATTNEILWILVADMDPVGLTEALLFRELLKATLTLKDEKI